MTQTAVPLTVQLFPTTYPTVTYSVSHIFPKTNTPTHFTDCADLSEAVCFIVNAERLDKIHSCYKPNSYFLQKILHSASGVFEQAWLTESDEAEIADIWLNEQESPDSMTYYKNGFDDDGNCHYIKGWRNLEYYNPLPQKLQEFLTHIFQ